jgi:predicted RNA-binding Zn-ribbon protein involved in translation (DUF1610 family)
MNEIVTFDCPHCGSALEAPAHMNGQTHPCPTCNGAVTLRVLSTGEAVTAGLVAGGLAVLASLFGLDD